MAADRRTRITIETERILIAARRQTARGWCQRCGVEVELLPSAYANDVLRATQERLQGLQHGKLHFERAKDGLLVCLKSLLRLLQEASGKRNP